MWNYFFIKRKKLYQFKAIVLIVFVNYKYV